MSDSFSRGFDILRLTVQIHTRAMSALLKVAIFVMLASTILLVLWFEPLAVIYGAFRWVAAWGAYGALQIDYSGIPVETSGGVVSYSLSQIYHDAWHYRAANEVLRTTVISAVVSTLIAIPASLLLFMASIWRGREATSELLARGEKLVSEAQLASISRSRGGGSGLKIGKIDVPEKVLNRNILALGSPQTGKSICIKRWMEAVRKRGDMVVVFDKTGDITAGHFNPARGDVLLNPLDSRSPPWSPWSEMRTITDAWRIAEALIPRVEGNNNFFNEGARQLFASLLTRVWKLKDRSLYGLLEAALVWDKEQKRRLLEGTEAAKHFEGDHRSGHDVDATMAVYTQSLRFLDVKSGGRDDFSIRDFITHNIARTEGKGEGSFASIQASFEREIQQLRAAREALSIGKLRQAEECVSRATRLFPLIPEGDAIPESETGFVSWWKQNEVRISDYWRSQDEQIDTELVRMKNVHQLAAERLKKEGAPWLFIGTDHRSLQATRPLLSLWLDAVADTIMSLPENRDRRIWVFLDELQALQELPSLQPLMTEGAKYGAAVVAGVQNIGQLRSTYGRDRSEVLLSLFQTKVIFRMSEPDTAKWVQSAIGDAIVEHMHESIRYGTSETMDGAQLSTQRTTEPIVMAGDIIRQPDLHCYITFPGDWPVGKAQLSFNPKVDILKENHPSLIRKPVSDTIFHALEEKGFRPIPVGRDGADPGQRAREVAQLRGEADERKSDDANPKHESRKNRKEKKDKAKAGADQKSFVFTRPGAEPKSPLKPAMSDKSQTKKPVTGEKEAGDQMKTRPPKSGDSPSAWRRPF